MAKSSKSSDDLARVIGSDGSSFTHLSAIAGLNPARDFRYMNLTGLDFSGQDLRAYRFYRSDVAGCNFRDALLSPQTLRGAINAPSIHTPLSTTFDISTALSEVAEAVDKELASLLRADAVVGVGRAPERLIKAMEHGSLGGGKRLRPHLVRQASAIFGLPPRASLRAALAVEMVHCYSLIHDDLPAMDDDDLRRGRPTVHKAFDDATAILAGDALLTHAFGVLADPATHTDAEVRTRLVAELVAGSGAGGMVGGQMRDIESDASNFSNGYIASMQAMKTGALIRAAVRIGAILGGADPRALSALTAYAEAAGRAFQLSDDILDLRATEARDQATHTNLEAARHRLSAEIDEAIAALRTFGPRADGLRATVRYFGSQPDA